jgi:hypothetical protein
MVNDVYGDGDNGDKRNGITGNLLYSLQKSFHSISQCLAMLIEERPT